MAENFSESKRNIKRNSSNRNHTLSDHNPTQRNKEIMEIK